VIRNPSPFLPQGAKLIPDEATLVFSGEIYDVYQWQQQLFNGEYATFEMLRRPNTASVNAIKDGKIVVLQQLQPDWPAPRYTTPGGRCDEGEDPLAAAQREMLEETGMRFKTWKLLSVSQESEKIECFYYEYFATDFIDEQPIKEDPGERITVHLMDLAEAREKAKNNRRMPEELLNGISKFEDIPSFLPDPTR
jgi:ADP-ribose pyrophosphatase